MGGREDLLRAMGYSDKAIEYIKTDHNFGRLENPTVDADHQGKCGDVLRVYLQVRDGIIEDARFEHIGCMGLQASAAGMTTLVRGRSLEEAEALEVDDLIAFVGGLPREKYDCAELARDALRKAIARIREG
jgi:nitrogen fixation NifU-like protein